MVCKRCNNEGAIAYRYIKDGKEYQVELCHDCYNLLLGRQEPAPKKKSFFDINLRCPGCGTSLDEIRRTGYIGCADCFKNFKNELVPVIDAFQNRAISRSREIQKEKDVMILAGEYEHLMAENLSSPANCAKNARRLKDIKLKLLALGVDVG